MSIMSQDAPGAKDATSGDPQAEALLRLRELAKQRHRLRDAERAAIVEARRAGAIIEVIAAHLGRSGTFVRNDLIRDGIGTSTPKSPREVSAPVTGE